MKDFTPEDLESLAVWLDKGAAVAKAKAGEYALQSDKANVDRQCKREQRLAFWAGVAREAARRLRLRGRKDAFAPPTLEEVLALAKSVGWPAKDAEEWYDHFQANGWKVGGKTKMVDWRAAARNGFRNWQRKGGERRPTQREAQADPKRWRAFLQAHGCNYEPFQSALQHAKTAFAEWDAIG